MQNSAYKKLSNLTLSDNSIFYVSIKRFTKATKLLKMLRYWGFKETGYEKRFGLIDNH